MNKIIVYTKDNCAYCDAAKNLLTKKGLQYTQVGIGSDITREDFVGLFPEVRSVPFIIIDGKHIGGYDKLTEWFESSIQREIVDELLSSRTTEDQGS